MTTMIVTGRLTKDAATHTDKMGNEYILLALAENIRKRNDNGEFFKNEKGHWECYPPRFHSVFVRGKLTEMVTYLPKGQLITVEANASFSNEKR